MGKGTGTKFVSTGFRDLFTNLNWISYLVMGLALLVILLVTLIVRLILCRIRGKKSK